MEATLHLMEGGILRVQPPHLPSFPRLECNAMRKFTPAVAFEWFHLQRLSRSMGAHSAHQNRQKSAYCLHSTTAQVLETWDSTMVDACGPSVRSVRRDLNGRYI